MSFRKITERRAATAARQLLYHRERIRWMEERMELNAATLEAYLVDQNREAAVVPGGYAVGLADEGGIVVSEPQAGGGFEQLKLLAETAGNTKGRITE